VETVATYTNLADVGGFFKERKKSDDKGGGSSKETEFTDTLEFTTEVVGVASPTLSFSAVPREFRLVKMSPKITGTRKDIHKLTVAFVKGDEKKDERQDDFPRRATDKALDVLKVRRAQDLFRTIIQEELRTQ